jgi:hypothetical protein
LCMTRRWAKCQWDDLALSLHLESSHVDCGYLSCCRCCRLSLAGFSEQRLAGLLALKGYLRSATYLSSWAGSGDPCTSGWTFVSCWGSSEPKPLTLGFYSMQLASTLALPSAALLSQTPGLMAFAAVSVDEPGALGRTGRFLRPGTDTLGFLAALCVQAWNYPGNVGFSGVSCRPLAVGLPPHACSCSPQMAVFRCRQDPSGLGRDLA